MHKTENRLKFALPTVPLLICFLWTSFYGLNFGIHWDETHAKLDSVRDSVNTGLLMQASVPDPYGKKYNYGGVNYLLTWSGFAPEVLSYLGKGPLTLEALSAVITPIVYTTEVRLRVRAIYLIISSLSILWLYCLAIVLGRSRVEAFLAAAILSCSWEVAYHSRWIAPDMVMMQFGLLSFLCLAVGSAWKKPEWFYLGAIGIGLAAGTKYPGGLILPFFLVGAGHALWQLKRSPLFVLKHSLSFVGTCFLTFAITTPGALLDPFRFFAQIKEQQEIYGGGFFGYTVKPGIQHFFKILEYFSLQVFSHYWSVSLVLAAFCLLGIVCLLLEFRLFAFLTIGFSLAYVAYFSQQAAMIVRNLMIVVPFLCLATARGITVLAQRFRPGMKVPVYALVGILLTVNLGWEIYAAHQVKKRANSAYFLRKFADYVQRSPGDTFFVSAKLASALEGIHAPLPGNIVTNPRTPYTKAAFFQAEGAEIFWAAWPQNWWGMYEKTFGALEVNLEAYANFVGNQRIILVTTDHLSRLPITEKDMLTP